MPTGKPSDEIVAIGNDTRFGQPGGADPKAARAEVEANPACVRQKLRRLATFVPGEESPTTNKMARAFDKRGLTELSMAEIWAIRRAQQAMGDYKAMDGMIDSISGKLVNKQVEVQVDSFAELVMAADKLDRDERERAANGSKPGE